MNSQYKVITTFWHINHDALSILYHKLCINLHHIQYNVGHLLYITQFLLIF